MPLGKVGDGVVIVTGFTTKMERLRVAACCGVPTSVTCAVNENVPVVVGVPVIAPEAGFNCKPGGRAPETTDHVRGPVLPPLPPMAVRVAL